MEGLLVLLAIGTGTFFAIRFHQQDKGWGWGLLYGLFLCPIALVHALIIALAAFFSGGSVARFARDEDLYTGSIFEYMANGEYDKAVAEYIKLGMAEWENGYSDRAVSYYNQAIKVMDANAIEPTDNPYYWRGFAWLELDEHERAIEDFSRIIEIDHDAETHCTRARIYTHLKDYEKALEDYEKAIGITPNAVTYLDRGIVYLNLGEQDKALNDFHIAIKLDQEPEAYSWAAKVFFEKKEFKKAIEEFTNGISALPDHTEAELARFWRLDPETESYHYDVAIDFMLRFYCGRGICYLNLEEYQKALEDFNVAINLKPNDANAYSGLDDFDKAIKTEAKHANSYIGRGTCYLYLGQHHEALNDLDMAINLMSANDAIPGIDPLSITSISIDHSYAYANRGLTYSMLNCESAAKKDFDKAVALGFDYSQIEEDLQELKGQSKRTEGNFKINPKLNVRREHIPSHTKSPDVSEEEMTTSELQQTVLDILTNNLRPGSSEAEDPNKQCLPWQAVSKATPESLRAFIDIHEAISAIVGPDHYRTRHAGRTSKERIGLVYVTHPIVDGKRARVQIQTLQLPLHPSWSGYIHAGLSGHAQVPIQAKYIENIGTRAGKPVFLVTDRPTPQLCEGLISAFRASSLFNDIQY